MTNLQEQTLSLSPFLILNQTVSQTHAHLEAHLHPNVHFVGSDAALLKLLFSFSS